MLFFLFSLIVLCGVIFTIIKITDAENISPIRIKNYQEKQEKQEKLKKKTRVNFIMFLAPVALTISIFSFILDSAKLLDFQWQFYIFSLLFILISGIGFFGFFFSAKYKIQKASQTILFIACLTLGGVLFLAAESMSLISVESDFIVLLTLWLIGSMPAFYFVRTKEIQILYTAVFIVWTIFSIIFYNLSNILFFNLSVIPLIQLWVLGQSFEEANKKSFPEINNIYSGWFGFVAATTLIIKNFLVWQTLEIQINYLYTTGIALISILFILFLESVLKKYFPKKYDINYFASVLFLMIMPLIYVLKDFQALIVVLASSLLFFWVIVDYYRHGSKVSQKASPLIFMVLAAIIGFENNLYVSSFLGFILFGVSSYLIFYKTRMPKYYLLIISGFIISLIIQLFKAQIDYRIILSILSLSGIGYGIFVSSEKESESKLPLS